MPAQKQRAPRKTTRRAAAPSFGRRLAGVGAAGARPLARFVARRPAPALGGLAFAILFSGMAANALTGQAGHHHQSPLLETRALLTASVERGAPARTAVTAVPIVREVQEALSEAGFYEADVDGRPGPETESAIREFQKAQNLKPEGAATPLVLSQIRQAIAVAPNPSPRPNDVASLDSRMGRLPFAEASAEVTHSPDPTLLKLGEEELVRRIQSGLSSAKVAELSADGIPGERTRSAIRTFQALEGMDVTGVPDPQVLQRLIDIGATD